MSIHVHVTCTLLHIYSEVCTSIKTYILQMNITRSLVNSSCEKFMSKSYATCMNSSNKPNFFKGSVYSGLSSLFPSDYQEKIYSAEHAGKLKVLSEILIQIHKDSEKIVIVSNHTKVRLHASNFLIYCISFTRFSILFSDSLFDTKEFNSDNE